ncbi:NAD-dependent epimerase/dehydratase family protein [Desulforamulus aquiferis]|uniref:NAD(P)-dependent oxidoreductase n=1 Tax=Desulforamulus aquiferis TaxID=1397668 RepID=A0AAW7ZE40_9FIRM|nr:NAD(P)-dependent oxidoreductase [Desulforamulus aquiferis]MDO7787424.1 NAD(P)-dependent oxidoreductase [Desulforamulus aquiferis]RYD02204.1 hypothetical protein N752_26215 [Desulforamulus aquiferis]
MKQTRVLVTGAGGFIGSHLVNRLAFDGLKVGALIRGRCRKEIIKPDPNINYISSDVLNFSKLGKEVKSFRPHLAFHLAGTRPLGGAWGTIQQAYQNNLTGTLNVLQALQENGCRAVIVVGSTSEYGPGPAPYKENQACQPSTAYGSSKQAATQLALLVAKMFGMPITVIRPTLVYGPGQGEKLFLSQLIKSLLANQPFAMTGGEQYRDFIYVDDVIEALWLAAATERGQGGVYNIGTGASITLREAANIVADQLGKAELLKVGVIPYSRDEQFAYCVDSTRAREILNWKPTTDFIPGVKKTIEWFIS